MKRYVRSANSTTGLSGEYIGGRLYDLPDEFWFDESSPWIKRFEDQDAYVKNFASNYVIYRPQYNSFELSTSNSDPFMELSDTMAIKDGVDVVAYPDHLEFIAYNGSQQEVAYLYPISDSKFSELWDLIDNSDFSQSITIENEIAQYAWNGASVEDVLKSWK